jgi:hypothetical protein
MRLPYVIDNLTHRLADILTEALAEHGERSLDVATAYFTVGGFGLLQPGLERLGSFRMILGAEPTKGEQVGLRPDSGVIKGLIERERVIANVLQSHEELAALQVAPQAIDPLQQTVATVIQNQLNHPNVDRKRAIAAIEFLTAPMLPVQLKELRKRYKGLQRDASIASLIAGIEAMQSAFGSGAAPVSSTENSHAIKLRREDLRLICFDVLSD